MSDQEQLVMDKLVEAWGEFNKIQVTHPDVVNDFRYHIHALQALVFSLPHINKSDGISRR